MTAISNNVEPVRAQPFSIDVDEAALEDLRMRLKRTLWPPATPGAAWEQGTNVDWLRTLCAYWASEFDWRSSERHLNSYPQFLAEIAGATVHFVHVRRGGTPLILTHGWPSSFLEYLPLVERLDGFDLVIPSLPGYGFSERPGVSTTRDVASRWHLLMEGLGYERYGACGTDFGASVATYMALEKPERMLGIHLSNLDNAPTPTSPLTDAERAYTASVGVWDEQERGYSSIQSTRPQSLAYGLTDSPAALAAWILEKWRVWADTGGDVDAHFDRDDLLTLITLYWVTSTIGTSIRDYFDNRAHGTATLPADARVSVPTGIANFHHSYVHEGVLPREWAERIYNIARFTDMPSGGHFAPVEEPDLLAVEIAEFFTWANGEADQKNA
jgi:pimeloyl-ACP methyl ester carboxylesterase